MVQADSNSLRRGLLGRTVVKEDLIVLGGVPPIPPGVYSPAAGIYAGNISINYTAAFSPNGYDIVNYTITLRNQDETLNKMSPPH